MKKLIIILSAILLPLISLHAQVDKEVEVRKTYIPTVTKATKPLLKAQIIDTAYINPDVDYSITPLSLKTPLQTRTIKPATVTFWEFNRSASSQIKAGIGLPLNSLLQAYWATHNASVGYFAANVDHSGNYSKIRNHFGDKVNATQVLNSIDLSGGLYVAGRTLAANINYYNDTYHRYAFAQTASPLVYYQNVGAAVAFGDDFIDLSRFNYNLKFEADFFSDRALNENNSMAVRAIAGQSIASGDLVAEIGYKRITGSNYINSCFDISAVLDKRIDDWALRLGAQYVYNGDKISGDNMIGHDIIPKISVRKSTPSALSPFAIIDGSVEQNSYAHLSQINPYIGNAISANSSADYNFIGGIEGQTTSTSLAYKFYAQYQIGCDSRYWVYNIFSVQTPSETSPKINEGFFTLDLATLITTSLNLDVDYKPFSNLRLGFNTHYNFYSESAEVRYINHRPRFEAALKSDYTLRKFQIGVSGKYISKRSFSVETFTPSSSIVATPQSEKLPAAFDLGAYAQWSKNDSLAIFIEGSNLCNADLYPWAFYRGYGVQVTAGVKINFR